MAQSPHIPWHRVLVAVLTGGFVGWALFVTMLWILPVFFDRTSQSAESIVAGILLVGVLGLLVVWAIALLIAFPVAMLAAKGRWTGFRHGILLGSILSCLGGIVFGFDFDMTSLALLVLCGAIAGLVARTIAIGIKP